MSATMPASALRELQMPAYITPIILLSVSNVFMTLAWYGHLKFKAAPLLLVILASWGIALIAAGAAFIFLGK